MPLATLVAIGVLCAAAIATTFLVSTVPDEATTGRREAGALLAALLAYSLFYGVFFVQSILSGNLIAPSDSLDFGVSAYLSSPTVWTEGMWSGYPAAADPQALTWYPVLQLFRALGADWNTFLIAAYVLTSATVFLFVRRLTRSTLAGAFSGLACGFSGIMVGYITNFNQIHAFAWVPLVLYGLQLIREGLHRPGTAVAAVAIALMWLAGHPQVPVYATYLGAGVIAGGILVDRPLRPVAFARLWWAGTALALGLMLAAIALIPMVELSGFSARADASWKLYASSALPVRELLALLVPFAFGGFRTQSGIVPYLGDTGDSGYAGLLTVALAFAALLLPSHRREAGLWLALTVVEVLLCLGPATPLGALFYYAPGYSGFQAPLRHLFLVTLCLAVSSGLAIAGLTRRRDRRGVLAAATLAVTLVGATGVAVLIWQTPTVREIFESHSSYAPWAIWWPLGMAGALVLLALMTRRLPDGRGGAVAFGVLLIAFQVGDLAMLHFRWPGRQYEYADIRRSEAVPHPRMVALGAELHRAGARVLATDGSRNQFLLPNLTRPWGIPAASGTGSLGIRRYLEAVSMETSGGVTPQALSAAHRGLDLFGVRYALVRQDSDLSNALRDLPARWQPLENLHYYEDDPDTHYTLFRNLRARPRAWCAAQALEVNPDGALTAIREGRLPDGSAFDPASTALLDSGPLVGWTAGATADSADATVARTSQNRYVVHARTPCLLVIGEVYYPWWRVSIDDAPVTPARVNYTMLGVAVPPGDHVVRLSMAPESLWIGSAVSGLGLLLLAALVVPVQITRRSPPQFNAMQVRRYYDRHTRTFVAFGRGGSVGAIHRAVWGLGADTRDQAFHFVDDQIARLIKDLPVAPNPPHVVDLGCGVGASLCYLAERHPFRGTGVTLSPVQARFAATRIQDAGLSARVVCIEADFTDLPSTIPAADLAYAIESFAHATDPARFFDQCRRLVRPGGVLAICDDFRRPGAGPAADRTINRFARGWHLNSLLTPDALHALARAAGFVHESTLDLSPWLERPRVRDRVLDALLGWLPLHKTSLGPVLGGTALQTCLRRGWTGYELVRFRREA